MRRRFVFGLLLTGWAIAATPAEELFLAKIQPVLVRDCQGCHGKQQALSGLDLTSRAGLLKGGARGVAVVPGTPAVSRLLHVLEGRDGLQMPPGGADKKLPAATVAAFREWIAGGAPWPERAAAAKWVYREEDLWAFRPVRPFQPGRRIDDFVNAKLAERGVRPRPRADRRTLIRRVTLDLTGLPPTPEEVRAFVADESPGAWAKLIDRLLASPRYGERWARHWLDVVRYADTNGYSNDFERPNAWRYRDYVIRSLNADKPYDRFVREQIAGDELFPGDAEARIASGFLRAGPWEHTAMSVEAVTRQLFLDDVTHATVNVFLGLTLGCARCHDHKFDPIPTRDYYRVQAVFAPTEFARPAVPFLASENTADIPAARAALQARADHAAARLEEYRRKAAAGLARRLGLARVEDLPPAELRLAMNTGEGLTPEEYEEYKLFQKHQQIFKESLVRFEPRAFAVSSGPADGATDGGPALKYPPRAEYKAAAVHILPGGNIQAPGEAVTPGGLSALATYGSYPEPEIPQAVEGRRAALANWIASPGNPLTARVIANRVWQYHFGRGIAGDASNFGKTGKRPTHPELLDWLAGSLVHNGWRIKPLHREILLSDAYQRAAGDTPDPYLATFPRQRLDAEELRDTLLAVSGELSAEAGGPGVMPQINEDVARQPQHRMGSVAPAYAPSPLRRQRNRRTIYTFQQRSLIDPLIDVFNGPSLDLSCDRREQATVPTQAFGLFNGQLVHDLALAMAVRLEREAPSLDGRLTRAFQLAFSRDPSPTERAAARTHFEAMLVHHRANPAPPRPAPRPIVHKITSELTGQVFSFQQPEDPSPYEQNLHPSQAGAATRALADVALALFNANEFVYVD